MEVKTRVAWWGDKKLHMLGASDSIATDAPAATVLALPGDVFIRRSHPKPFEKRRSLARILPGLLEDALLEDDRGNCRTLMTTRGVEGNRFTSFSIRTDTLEDFVNKTAVRTTHVIRAVAAPTGLAFYAPAGQASIVVGPVAEGVAAVAVGADGAVLDFRSMPAEKWQREARLTLAAWQSAALLPVVKVGEVFLPPETAFQTAALPRGVAATDAAAHGVLELLKQGRLAAQTLRVRDPNTHAALHALWRRTLPLSAALLAVAVLAGLALAVQRHTLSREEQTLTAAIDGIFTEAVPGTPLVDAPLQLSRRLNELSVLNGQGVVSGEPLAQRLTSLQQALAAKGVALTLDELTLTGEALQLRGAVPELAAIDTLQAALRDLMPAATITLHSANLNAASGKVDFHLEARK